MIKKLQLTEKKEKRTYPKSKWTPIPTTYPGEKVQIDIKYVPQVVLTLVRVTNVCVS